jgi:hypothetical protein
LGTGQQYDVAHLTEVAQWDNPERIRLDFFDTLPLSPYTLAGLESVPLGRGNWWHDFTEEVRRGEHRRWHWIFVPSYVLGKKYSAVPPAGWNPSEHTLAHAKKVAETSPQYVGRRVELTREQMYWWETERRSAQKAGELNLFLTNHAATPEESFQHSGQSAFDIELYGYVKLDLAHDSDRTSVGNYARWVESEQLIKDHGEFSLTARQTRLDLKATGPTAGGMHSSGLIEVDFYGGGNENKNTPMMRHAYMNLEWPEERFSILAGQTFDVISPLWMPTLNYTVGWWQGNIGYRRPQLRLTKGFELAKDMQFKLEAAATRDIGRANGFTASYSDTGQDSSIPALQGRASLTLPGFNSKPTTIGVSGHWAEEEINYTNTFANPQTVDSWSINLDVTVPITSWLSLTGEAFSGRDLDAYLGGIGQGYDTTLMRGVRSDGGWAALTLKPMPEWQFNVGGGFDKVPKADVCVIVGMQGPSASSAAIVLRRY